MKKRWTINNQYQQVILNIQQIHARQLNKLDENSENLLGYSGASAQLHSPARGSTISFYRMEIE